MNMLSAVQSVLAALARYDDAERLYAFELGGLDAGTLTVERWQGWESLSVGYEWWVDLLATDAGLSLESLHGQHATLWTRTASGERLPRSGLVRSAQCIGSDGGLARYRLCLAPWTWLLAQGRHSRVFQDRTVVGILETVLAGYAPLASWQVAEEVGAFLAGTGPRSYCVQYHESDADFLARLLAGEGLGWRIEEYPDAPAGHRLVLFAQSGLCPADATSAGDGGIRFHRSDATESADSVQAFGSTRAIGATALTLLSDDYRTGQCRSVQLPLGDGNGDAAAALELYDPSGAYSFADRSQAERAAGLLAQAHAATQQQWLGQSSVRSFRAGTWFALADAPLAGDAPAEALLVSVQQAGINNLPAVVRESLDALLGPSPGLAGAVVDALSDTAMGAARTRAERVGYGNAFVAVPRELPWRPALADDTGLRLNPRPTAPGHQTAIVTGHHGELHSDALGRVRVRFHFQPGAGGAHDSCWLRVAQRYAGPGVGSQFLPRVGQEVLVGFLHGDIDRPVVVGSLYNGQGEAGIAPTPGGASPRGQGGDGVYRAARDHLPSAQANATGGHAPAWHGMSGDADGHRNPAAMSGFKSKEFGGSGHNRLVFDDSDGQLRLQLATTHAASELTLGHLIHQADNYRGSFRGEGFELRSDRWGAVRGQAGLWLSAYATDEADPAGQHLAASALLQQAAQLGQSFSDIAATHLTVQLAGHRGAARPGQSRLIADQPPLKALHTSAAATVDGSAWPTARADAPRRNAVAGKDRVPHSGDALLGLAAPAGIGLVAGQGLHWSTGETLTLASGQSSNAAIAGDLRLHTGQAIGWLAGAAKPSPSSGGSGRDGADPNHTLALVTAESDLTLQAQHDQAKLQARDQLKLVSANAQLELAAGKTVHLATEGGAAITIEGGNISVTCPGNITVHASRKSFVGPVEQTYPLPQFPGSVCVECLLKAQAQGAPLAAKNA